LEFEQWVQVHMVRVGSVDQIGWTTVWMTARGLRHLRPGSARASVPSPSRGLRSFSWLRIT
jgi:hypothetical protein